MESKSRVRRSKGIHIDIPNVTPNTKLCELTVDQFVKLLVQVSAEMSASRRAPNREVIALVMAAIRKHLAENGAKSGVNNAVRQTQLAILDKMPDFFRKVER